MAGGEYSKATGVFPK